MKKLSKNWFVEDLVDFEYKKYILLAYLQQVEGNFTSYRLYPNLAELVEHYRNLVEFTRSVGEMKEHSHGDLKEIDLKNFRLVYESTLKNDDLMAEIEEIVNYSLPRIKGHLHIGKDLYESIEHQMFIEPVGIVPLYKEEGYLLLKTNENRETRVYQYRVTLFEGVEERFRGIHTTFVETFRNSLINTFEGIKRQLIKEKREFPNPATYLIESEKQYPIDETLLPVASRMLVRYLFKP